MIHALLLAVSVVTAAPLQKAPQPQHGATAVARAAAVAAVPSLPVLPAAAVPAALTTPAQLKPVAQAIAQATSVDQALLHLTALGAVSAQKLPDDPTDRLFTLKRLWDVSAPALTETALPVDDTWAVPALTVETPKAIYKIHPVAHGQVFAPNKKQVRALVDQVRRNGHALVSEEGLPAHYGYSFGRETLDHAVDRGAPLEVAPAAKGLSEPVLRAAHALMAAVGLSPLILTSYYAAEQHSLLAALAAAALLSVTLLARRGFLALYKWQERLQARQADAAGAPEMAEQLRRQAEALHKPALDALDVARLHLPPGVGAAHDPFAPRSAAIAAALAEAPEAHVVHVLVGYKHAADIGWRLRSQLP